MPFIVIYETWKSSFGLRGAFASVKEELRARGRVVMYRKRTIIAPLSRPERVVARKQALAPNADDPILGDQAGIVVTPYVFHQNADGERIVIQNGNRITFEGYVQNNNAWEVILQNLRPHHTHWKFRFYVIATNNQPRRKLRFPLMLRPNDLVRIAAQFTAQTTVATVNTMLKFVFTSDGQTL